MLTHRERFVRTLTGREVDRVPFIKVFGGTNAMLGEWEAQCPGLTGNIDRILQFEGTYRGWGTTPVNVWMTRRGEPRVVEENESQIVRRYPDGTVEILVKGGDFHRQTVEWPVKNAEDWRRIRAQHLQPDDPERFPSDWPALVKAYAARDYPLQLTHGGVYGFARNLMGDEALLYAFYDEPALVHDMMDRYTDLVLAIWSRMVRDVEFDLIEFWEDMASKNGCLISPATFREFMLPNYRRVAEFARAHGIEILLVDSDGYTDLVLSIWDRMVGEVQFDLIEFWEDMASKNGCLISPATFREFMLPNYRRVAEFAKRHGIEVLLVDSDGYIDDLAEVMMEGGVTAMYPFEVGAGCDVEKARRRYPSLGMIGGLAKESMIYGKAAIDRETEKARRYIRLGGFIPGPDHFVLSSVPWENYRYFMERLREVVMTTRPDGGGVE